MVASDSELLRRYADARDESAFGELVRRHVDAIYSAALRRVGYDHHLAEDVCQRVFVALARSARGVSRHPYVLGWLHTTTRHVSATVVRTEVRRRQREEAADVFENVNAADASIDWQRVAPVLDDAIGELREPDRVAVLLRFLERKSFSQIGAVLRVSEDAARMRVDRALEKLRHALVRRGIVSTSVALAAALSTDAVHAAPVTLAPLIASGVPAASISVATWTVMNVGQILAAAVVLSASGFALFQAQELRRTRVALSSAEAQSIQLKDELARATAALTDEKARLAAKETTDDRSAQSTAKAVVSRRAATPAWDSTAAGKDLMRRHPEVRTAFMDWVNASIDGQWRCFYKQAKLTPAQIEAFRQILRQGYAMTRSPDDGSDRPLTFATDNSTNGASYGALQPILGSDGMAQFLAYSNTLSARDLTSRLASSLAFTDEPISPAQAQHMVGLLGAAQNVTNGYPPVYDWNKVMASAKDFLTPAQLEALSGLQAQAEFNRLYSIKASALQANTQGAKPNT